MKTIKVRTDPPEVFVEDASLTPIFSAPDRLNMAASINGKGRTLENLRKEPPTYKKLLEDFLVTDDLFVEYFNKFLALPTFPVPLSYNKESKGFEVVTNAKKELANQIKAAIRSQKRTPKIYKASRNHSYIDIPLIPIENTDGPENVEINTSFNVMTLNKEQGIHWIKAERLPTFLESDLYVEYRLSKLLSQARLTGEHGEYVLMEIDHRQSPKKERKVVSQEVPKVDPKQTLMKDMYVCMGNATATETDAWYSKAKMSQDLEVTYSAASTRPSSDYTRTQTRPTSARPASAYSALDRYPRADSGMGSSLKSSVRCGSNGNVYQSKYSLTGDSEDEILMSKLFASEGSRPRLNQNMCEIAQDQHGKKPVSATVYTYPKVLIEQPSEVYFELGSNLSVDKADDDASMDSGKGDENLTIDGQEDIVEVEDEALSFQNYDVYSIDDMGAVIVGTVLKRSISLLTNHTEEEVQNIPEIENIFPNKSYTGLTMDHLDRLTYTEKQTLGSAATCPNEQMKQKMEYPPKRQEEESDVDSLLDSDDDYEEADLFFRKHKHKTFTLSTYKGIEQFKKFLARTSGEKHWNLWLDIDKMRMDKARLLDEAEELQQYLNILREKYDKPGTTLALSHEQKKNFGLSDPSAWTLEKLLSIQNKLVEPLLLYWAPSFLLKQLMRANPDKNYLYLHQKLLRPNVHGAFPSKPTANLLPLRPKSCIPRIRQDSLAEVSPQVHLEITHHIPDTSPPVGMKRSYLQPTLQFLMNWQKSQKIQRNALLSPQLPSDKSARPQTRPISSAKSSSLNVTRVMSGRPRSRSDRPSSAQSVATSISVESATGRVRIKTPHLKNDKLKSSSRPSSAVSSIGSAEAKSQTSEASLFLGGRRMETLLQALHHEQQSGGFFRKYVEKSDNEQWVNCLNFWHDVQEYHCLFYAQSLDAFVVEKKAKAIYSHFIVTGCEHPVGCTNEIAEDIFYHISPPFEELFDQAEVHTITVLYTAWVEMTENDKKTYGKVELIEVNRRLETKSKYVHHLQRKGLIKERVLTPDDPMEGYSDPVYDESLLEQISEDFRDYTLEKLVHNRIELEHYRQFLEENYASMDLKCWMDIEAFRRIPHTDEKKRDAKAKEINQKYFNRKYFFGANSPAGKEGQDKVMAAGGGWGKLMNDRPPNPVIIEAQKFVRDRLEKKWLPLFLLTPGFAERQKPRTSMDSVVDDVLVQKRKKSQAVWKLLESRWVSSSQEIITFRNALLNPVTSMQFRRYVSIQGDSLENDVLFWQEVQKYKDLYHAHTDDSIILQKINTIINCFIDSQLPPTLQIDIPQEIADKIIDHKYERSPYLFRESQLIVFRYLFGHWNDFCNFRANLAEEKIMPTIERRRKHAKVKDRKRQQELEERLAKKSPRSKSRRKMKKEAERRAAMGLSVDDDDAYHDPFQAHEGSDREEHEAEDKDKVVWSYSKYISSLETEELLNNTDETSFSSLLTDSASVQESIATDGDKQSAGSKQSGQDKKVTLIEETQTGKRRLSKASTGKRTDDGDEDTLKKRPSSETEKQPTLTAPTRPGSKESQRSKAENHSPQNGSKIKTLTKKL